MSSNRGEKVLNCIEIGWNQDLRVQHNKPKTGKPVNVLIHLNLLKISFTNFFFPPTTFSPHLPSITSPHRPHKSLLSGKFDVAARETVSAQLTEEAGR